MSLFPHTTDSLNPAQRAAVEHGSGPLLVVAGAGSGKTRVLTARIARLLERGVPPERILAFTFTNRAAREMRERVARVAGDAAPAVWVGTFHATAVRMLRREAQALGLPAGFAIYDREDQEQVLRDVLERLGGAESVKPAALLARISDAKNALVTPEEMARLAISPAEKRVAECFALYQGALRASGALDFDDLIAESVRMLEGRPEAAGRWCGRFEHVLVDEYQDTNHAQFRLVQALAHAHGNLFVVGDDDQSIYGWRGADLRNVLDFERAFPGAAVIRLEQNYRSCGNILKAANAVIAHNRHRQGKQLWCDREDGRRLRFVLCPDEIEEARRIRQFIAGRVAAGGRLDDCAVLYRTHAQSRAIETELRQSLMPYQIVGGVSFFQRREVKDVLAYLRLIENPTDAVAFWRVWNTPRRGLGDAVRAQLEARMREYHEAPLEALRRQVAAGALARAALRGAGAFVALLDGLAAEREAAPETLIRRVIEESGYAASLEQDDPEEERRANVEELVAAAAAFSAVRGGTLQDFLAETALLTDADRLSEGADRVLLLTAHNAKGLEFPVVIVAGLEEGLLPHGASSEDEAELEEERRLFYVAITRAREEVLLTAAAYRRRFDGARGAQVSRFVGEIPEEVLEREALPGAAARGMSQREDAAPRPGLRHRGAPVADSEGPRHRALGREVFHERFGRGVVVEADGEGADARFTVRFGTVMKRVMGRYLDGGSDADSS